jgi:hypothetical protein
VWTYLGADIPLADNLTLDLETSPRWREESVDVVESQATLEVDVSPSVTLGAGAHYVEFAGGREIRPHQRMAIKAGPLRFRTQLEQRFFQGADRMQFRLRQRVATGVPLDDRTELKGSVELFYILRTEDRADDPRVDNWRFIVGVDRQLSEKLTLGVGYLLMYAPRGGGPGRLSHVPQLGLSASF